MLEKYGEFSKVPALLMSYILVFFPWINGTVFQDVFLCDFCIFPSHRRAELVFGLTYFQESAFIVSLVFSLCSLKQNTEGLP